MIDERISPAFRCVQRENTSRGVTRILANIADSRPSVRQSALTDEGLGLNAPMSPWEAPIPTPTLSSFLRKRLRS